MFRPLLLTLLAASQLGAASLSSKEELLWKKLERSLGKIERESEAVVSIHLIDLESGEEISVRSDEVIAAASTIKIGILAELLRQHDSQEASHLKLDDLYELSDADVVGGAGLLASCHADQRGLRIMIWQS